VIDVIFVIKFVRVITRLNLVVSESRPTRTDRWPLYTSNAGESARHDPTKSPLARLLRTFRSAIVVV